MKIRILLSVSAFLLMFMLNSFAGTAFAQTGSLTGTVTDATTGEELAGATVLIVDLERGASSDSNGEYSIQNIPVGTYTVRYSFVGYQTIRSNVSIQQGLNIQDIELELDATGLEEIVVSGIASRTSRAISQVSVSKIDVETVTETNSFQGIDQLLAGKASGVTIQPASGNPGGGVRFRVRSGTGLGGDGQPVIYIDGVRVDNSQVTGFGVGGQGIGVLSDLDPNQITNIEILKGPAAAALYGTSGSNGVVLIETKNGQGIAPGQVHVDFRSVYGMNTKQQEYADDSIISYEEANEVIDSNPLHENTISISGGSNSVRYYTSLGQRYEEGLGPKNYLDRQSFRGNIEAYPNEMLTISASTGFTQNQIARPQNDNNIFGYLGNLVLAPGGATYNFTAREAIDAISDETNTNRFVGSLGAVFTPIENFSLSGSIGLDGSNLRQVQFFSPDFGYAGIINGERAVFDRENEQFTYDANATYAYDITPELQATSIIGTQIFELRRNTTFVQKNDFPSSAIRNVGAGAEFIDSNETSLHAKEAGIFTQHDFLFRDTYSLSLGGRLDYASAIGSQAPSIFYPQARASVRLDQFDFLPELFDLFKLRAAYGETGQLPAIFDGVDLLYGAEAFAVGRGLTIEEVGNPEIEPERIRELEIGVDTDFLDSYTAEITYYKQWAEDSIFEFDRAPSTGLTFDSPAFNVGGVEGQGVEIAFGGTPIRQRNFELSFNVLYSFQENEVKDLGGAQPIFDGFDLNVIDEGLPKSSFYVLDVDGAARDANGEVILSGTGLPAPNVSDERVLKGIPYPEHNGSINLNMRLFRNFEIYSLVDWATGLSVYNNTRIFQILFGNDVKYSEKTEAFLDADPGSAEYDALADEVANLNANYDGNFIEDADFIKLREVSVAYDFTELLRNAGLGNAVRNMKISLSGRNLVTWTKYTGIDPEVNFTGARSLTQGADFLTLQTPRVFYATLNIGF
ncbi:MAG: carboxypeptidase-like regulatory domain-containing protein [Balneolaceae bacterium]